jgi:hypothetical protein
MALGPEPIDLNNMVGSVKMIKILRLVAAFCKVPGILHWLLVQHSGKQSSSVQWQILAYPLSTNFSFHCSWGKSDLKFGRLGVIERPSSTLGRRVKGLVRAFFSIGIADANASGS